MKSSRTILTASFHRHYHTFESLGLKLLIFFFLEISNGFAQTPAETAEKIYLANINTLMIFTAESGLSSGAYRFTKSNYKMKVYSLPFSYSFEPFNAKANWFLDGGVGYSITRLDTRTVTQQSGTDITLTHDNKLQTYTAGLGGGIRYKTDMNIDLLASLGIIYSRVGTSVKPQDDVGGAIEDFFDSQYNDNLTYKLLLSAQYIKEIESFKLHTKATFKSYETKASFTWDALSGFTTQSDVTSLFFGIETPALLQYDKNYLTLEGYSRVNYLHGDITDVVQFNRYINMGAIAYWYTPQSPSWAKRFYTEASTVRAKGLEGYNVGIGFSLDY